MNIHIELTYIGWESTITQKGNFRVDDREFREVPDKAAAEVTLNWIKGIRRERGINNILKVTYNNEHDITDLVKDLDTRIHDDGLPF
ncbi:hypothetical protein [Niallia sp. Krafla_26]|uniref:hypothetical protein n=1 Tax=Niallia sp. Krafla_26 TaxID=3064703 RepID=UPI003D169277